MTDKGELEEIVVGLNDDNEIVIKLDDESILIFLPDHARQLAALLIKKADLAEERLKDRILQ